MTILLPLAAGFIFLIVGAEALVRGASRLASLAGVSHLVIGLTVVAYGTSAPELAVSLKASLAARPDIAVGNAVGSCTFNILAILGVSALVSPLAVDRRLLRLDLLVMIAAAAALWLMALAGAIGRLDGLLLFGSMLVYTVYMVRKSRRVEKDRREAGAGEGGEAPPRNWKAVALSLLFVAVGLALLVQGSEWLVEGASALARRFGVSELLIGVTIVSVGTSLPELATSMVASLRGERDIAVGNVVGSNIFNILVVLGLPALVAPAGIAVAPAALSLDIPVMAAASAACLPVFFTNWEISRREGLFFLISYAVYISYLAMRTGAAAG